MINNLNEMKDKLIMNDFLTLGKNIEIKKMN